MEEMVFNSIDELYMRVLPALKSKKKELGKSGYSYITEIDIFNCLRTLKWNKESELALCDIVDDILNISNKKIDEYLRNHVVNKQMNTDIELPKLKD